MAVLIKNMETPKCCANCKLVCNDEYGLEILCVLIEDGIISDDGRRDDCPLEESHEIQSIIRCKDCKLYIHPEQGKVYGRCTYSRDSTPRIQTDFCSYAKQSD